MKMENKLGDPSKIFGNVQSWLSKRLAKNEENEKEESFKLYIRSPIKTIVYEGEEIQLINKQTFEDEWNEDEDVEYQLMIIDEGAEIPVRAGMLKKFETREETKLDPKQETKPVEEKLSSATTTSPNNFDFERFFTNFLGYHKQVSPNLQTNVYNSLESEIRKRDIEIKFLKDENKQLYEKLESQKERLQDKLDTQKKDLSDKLESQKESYQKQINELTIKTIQLESQIKNTQSLESKLESLSDENKQLKEQLVKVEKEKEISDLEKRYKRNEKLPTEFESSLEKIITEKLPTGIDLIYDMMSPKNIDAESQQMIENARRLADGK